MLCLGGVFNVAHYRDGRLLRSGRFKNGITFQGKTAMLRALFGDVVPTTDWFIGLMTDATSGSDAGFTVISDLDTMAAHPGWNESASYGSFRAAWTPDLTPAQNGGPAQLLSPAFIDFIITQNDTITGLFLCDDSVVGRTTGFLWSTSPFVTSLVTPVRDPWPVVAGDIFQVKYTLNLQDKTDQIDGSVVLVQDLDYTGPLEGTNGILQSG